MNITTNENGYVFYHYLFYFLLKEIFIDKIYEFKSEHPEFSREYKE